MASTATALPTRRLFQRAVRASHLRIGQVAFVHRDEHEDAEQEGAPEEAVRHAAGVPTIVCAVPVVDEADDEADDAADDEADDDGVGARMAAARAKAASMDIVLLTVTGPDPTRVLRAARAYAASPPASPQDADAVARLLRASLAEARATQRIPACFRTGWYNLDSKTCQHNMVFWNQHLELVEARPIEDAAHACRRGASPEDIVMGVFVKRRVPKGCVVGDYASHASVYVWQPDDDDEVTRDTIFEVQLEKSKTHCLIVDPNPLLNPLAMLNDPRGITIKANGRDASANCVVNAYLEFNERRSPAAVSVHVLVRAKREIKVGEELLIDYGDEYWRRWGSMQETCTVLLQPARAAAAAMVAQVAQAARTTAVA